MSYNEAPEEYPRDVPTGNYRWRGFDPASEADRAALCVVYGGSIEAAPLHAGTIEMIPCPSFRPHAFRQLVHLALMLAEAEELIPRYPDIEQMLLDCGHSLG